MEDNALLAFSAMAGVLWAAVEGLANSFNKIMAAFGKAVTIPKDLFALILGPVMGIVWYTQGYIPLGDMAAAWAYLTSALYGLLGMFVATLFNDKAVKPLTSTLGKG